MYNSAFSFGNGKGGRKERNGAQLTSDICPLLQFVIFNFWVEIRSHCNCEQTFQSANNVKTGCLTNYCHLLLLVVMFLFLNVQVFCQWWKGGLLQDVLAGAGRSLQVLRRRLEGESLPRKVVEALHAGLSLLNDSMAADGPTGSPLPPKT